MLSIQHSNIVRHVIPEDRSSYSYRIPISPVSGKGIRKKMCGNDVSKLLGRRRQGTPMPYV